MTTVHLGAINHDIHQGLGEIPTVLYLDTLTRTMNIYKLSKKVFRDRRIVHLGDGVCAKQ